MSSVLVLIGNAIGVYELIILIRCILSFIQPDPSNPIVRFIYEITEPLLDAVRRSFPVLMQGGIDFSPIVVIFLLHFTRNFIYSLA